MRMKELLFLRSAGTSIVFSPERYWPVRDAGFFSISCGVPCGHHIAAVNSSSRPDVQHVIGAADGLLIVLYYDQGVSQVPQLL